MADVYKISIHALLAESDLLYHFCPVDHQHFYPRSPCGERPPRCRQHLRGRRFLSTLSLRRATAHDAKGPGRVFHFYPRSPCGERPYGRINDISRLIFLSTLSLRRATVEEVSGDTWTRDFYPRSPCGERPRLATRSRHYPMDFYPRSPCGERHDTSSLMQCQAKFLSTLSLRRATVIFRKRDTPSQFLSTLSLRRATRFGRVIDVQFVFLSTLSLRRATSMETFCQVVSAISIHALLAESDCYSLRHSASCRYFYPRSPCGERRAVLREHGKSLYFYPRSPCGERHPSRIRTARP